MVKGYHVGSKGRVVKMLAAISFQRGVNFCKKYDKLDGGLYADIISRNFKDMS